MTKENVVTVKNKVILNSIQDLQRLSLPLVNNLRGRFQIKFGMTSLFNNGAFTLIELLVVVLIIGILAAVAVPQYQKAVDKSRFSTLKNMAIAMKTAQEVYFLGNGSYANNFETLDLSPSGCSLSNDKTICYYSNGKCYLSCTPTGSCGGCLLNLDENSIVIFLSSKGWKNFQCYASKNSQRANQLCQSDTGKISTESDNMYNKY